jgi:hypothetical protein
VRIWCLAFSVTVGATLLASPASMPGPAATAREVRALPITAHHRYRVNAAIRPAPLPFLWIGRDNVGAAELIVRRGSGDARAFEFAAGSDPKTAPRRVNRWGYMAEMSTAGVTHLVGFIKQSDERSMAEVQRSLDREAASKRYPFKVYAGDISALSATTGDTLMVLERDVTYRDLDSVLALLPATLAAGGKTTALRAGTGPGFLQALMSLIHARVEAWRLQPSARAGRTTVQCFFNNQLYQLSEQSVTFVPSMAIGGRTYTNVLRSKFEGTQPGTSNRMPFEIVYGTSGELAEAPLRIVIQARWWFQIEFLLVPSV